jgi:hypothetical protein
MALLVVAHSSELERRGQVPATASYERCGMAIEPLGRVPGAVQVEWWPQLFRSSSGSP